MGASVIEVVGHPALRCGHAKMALEIPTRSLLSSVPTALGLYFLRDHARAWRTLAKSALGLASTAPLAALTDLLAGLLGLHQGIWVLLGFFCLARIGATPFLGAASLLAATLSRDRRERRLFIVAACLQAAAAGCLVLRLFVLRRAFGQNRYSNPTMTSSQEFWSGQQLGHRHGEIPQSARTLALV
jgi:hypothetical protein